MANTIRIDIVSAEEEIWSGDGVMVFAPAEMGEIGIAPQHAPLLTRLQPGEIRVQQESGEEQFFYVSGGMLEVQGHGSPYCLIPLCEQLILMKQLRLKPSAEQSKRSRTELERWN